MGGLRRFGVVALALVFLGGAAAACGDDDDSGDDAEAVDSGSDTTSDNSDDSSDDSGDESSSGGDFSDTNCRELAATIAGLSGALTGNDDLGDVGDAFDEMADAVPDEVSDDLRTLADAYRDYAELIGDIDLSDPGSFDDPEVAAAMEQANEIFSDPDVVEAEQNLEEFGQEACGGAFAND